MLFLASLAKLDTNITATDFPDKTGHECFVNSIHVEDYVDSNYLSYACSFVNECFDIWRLEGRKDHLNAIISMDEFSTVVKLHVVRDGESWLSENLDEYSEAILLVDSSESWALKANSRDSSLNFPLKNKGEI